jgi:hypothetical protein
MLATSSHQRSAQFARGAMQCDARSTGVAVSNQRPGLCAGIARVLLLTRMLAVADPVATHTGLASPLLAV